MYEPTGAFAAEIIESMAQESSQAAAEEHRSRLTNLLAERLKMEPSSLPNSLVSLLLQPLSSRHASALTAILNVTGSSSSALTGPDSDDFAKELSFLAKSIRQEYRPKRNQASYIKTVVRPLQSLWLKRWRLEREDFDFAAVSARADRLNSRLITNTDVLDQWARDVLVFFHDTAVEPETSMETSKRPRGTVSEAGFRAYRLAWINFISENKYEILNRLRNDPALSKSSHSEVPNSMPSSVVPMVEIPSLVMGAALASPNLAWKTMKSLKRSNSESDNGELDATAQTSHIEVTLQPDDTSTPRVSRSWEFPAPDLVAQFQQWAAKLSPLLKLNEVPFNGTLKARTPWGDQEVRLTNATAADIDNWGTMMIQP